VIGRHDDPVADDADGEAIETSSPARTSGAAPGVGLVDRTVGRADEQPAVIGEELVRPPVERSAGVDALVDVPVEGALEVHHEGLDAPAAPVERELRRGARGKVADRRGPFDWIAHDRWLPGRRPADARRDPSRAGWRRQPRRPTWAPAPSQGKGGRE